MMADLDRLQQDLGFVRQTVTHAGPRAPVSLYFLWSAIMLCGFILGDLRPTLMAAYWMVAGPLGGIASGYLGWRDQRQHGHLDREVGIRWAWHWTAFMAAIVLLVPLGVGGRIPWDAFGPVVLVMIALTYFQAGVHLNPPMRWIGILAAIGYLVVLTMTTHAWTIAGVMLAAGSALAGIQESRARAAAAH
jgi:hypothetical protein